MMKHCDIDVLFQGYVRFDANGSREESQLYIYQYQTAEFMENRILVGDVNIGGDRNFTARNTTVVWLSKLNKQLSIMHAFI